MTIESFGCSARCSSACYSLQAGASLAGMTGVAAVCELDGAGGKDGEGSAVGGEELRASDLPAGGYTARRAIDYRAAGGGAALSGGGLFAEAGFIGAYEEDHVEALAHVHRRDGQGDATVGRLLVPWSLVFLLLPGSIVGRAWSWRSWRDRRSPGSWRRCERKTSPIRCIRKHSPMRKPSPQTRLSGKCVSPFALSK